jgi:hypothetical protein
MYLQLFKLKQFWWYACKTSHHSVDSDIVIAALQTLAVFVEKHVQSNHVMWWHGDAALNAHLFSL